MSLGLCRPMAVGVMLYIGTVAGAGEKNGATDLSIEAVQEIHLRDIASDGLVELLPAAAPETAPVSIGSDPFWPSSGVVNLGGGGRSVLVHCPAAMELVRRGVAALPVLLQHLTDKRLTKLTYVVSAGSAKPRPAPLYSDEYDPKVRGAATLTLTGKVQVPIEEGGVYTFKVGDLCYAALGQIVNRDLRAVRSHGENAGVYSGTFSPNPGDYFRTMNSPVSQPAIAAAARVDWANLTAAGHADFLRNEAERGINKRSRAGALTRLSYYHPTEGATPIISHLQRQLVNRVRNLASAPVDRTDIAVATWDQAEFVRSLNVAQCDLVQPALFDLFQRAVAAADKARKAMPPDEWDPDILGSGNDLALVCAQRIAHHGHDPELRQFIMARIDMLNSAKDNDRPSTVNPMVNLGMIRRIQADNCRTVLAELDQLEPPRRDSVRSVSASDTGRLIPLLRVTPSSIKRQRDDTLLIGFQAGDVSPDRIFAARVIIDFARDDIGATLFPLVPRPLVTVAVGLSSSAALHSLPLPNLFATLTRPAPQATRITAISGRVELVIPDLDPRSKVAIPDIGEKSGQVLEAEALRALEISITPQIVAGDVELVISDPHQRFLNVEFRDATGNSLIYNHNGWSHNGGDRVRRDTYRVGASVLSATALVIWLKTEKAFLVVPFTASDLELPSI